MAIPEIPNKMAAHSVFFGLLPNQKAESKTMIKGFVDTARLPIPAAEYFMAYTYKPR